MTRDIGTRCQNFPAEEQPIRFRLEEVEMSQADTTVIAPDPHVTAEILDDELVEDGELVEEISIDGMCGIYRTPPRRTRPRMRTGLRRRRAAGPRRNPATETERRPLTWGAPQPGADHHRPSL
jgi:mycofactocin precursor